MFKCEDIQEGDVLVGIARHACCWREGSEYKVQRDGHGLFVIASCEARLDVLCEIESNGGLNALELRSMHGPW